MSRISKAFIKVLGGGGNLGDLKNSLTQIRIQFKDERSTQEIYAQKIKECFDLKGGGKAIAGYRRSRNNGQIPPRKRGAGRGRRRRLGR